MIRLTLSDADRERLGAPDVLEYDETSLMLSEARALQKATKLTPAKLMAGLEEFEPDAVAGLVWLALYRKGVNVDFDTLDFDLFAVKPLGDDEPGKG